MICVNTLKVSPSSLTLKEGDWYYDATVEICPTNATCSDVRWTSSNTNVATVNETTGYIHAVGKGTATIRATAQDGSGKTDSIAVTVIEDVKITAISLCDDEIFIRTGNTQTLCANIEPINATTPALIWSSSNPAVATVDYNVVRGVSAGTAVITAHATDGSGKCACCTVTVYDSAIKILEKDLINGNMAVGDSRVFHAAIIPHSEAGNENDFVWISDNPGVISIDANTGFAQVLGTGDFSVNVATISVTSPSHPTLSDSMMVFVDRYDVTSFSITPENAILKIGDKTKMNANIGVIKSNGVYKENLVPRIIWSSSDEYIAEINEFGEVTCKANGSVTITGRILFSNDTAQYTVTIMDREKVTITKDITANNTKHFNVIFGEAENAIMWKNIGVDLSNQIISDLEAESRYAYNITQTYTEKQLAFLYLFDPFGVAHYVKNYGITHNISDIELLFFKDNVYKHIFGETPRLFLQFPNGTIQYYDDRYINDPEFRNSVYSYAEFIFGMHVVVNQMKFWNFAYEIILDFLSYFDNFSGILDVIGKTELAAELLLAIFYGKTIKDGFGEALKVFLKNWLDNYIKEELIERVGTPIKLIETAYIVGNNTVEFFRTPTAEEVEIWSKIKVQPFDTYFVISSKEISVNQIC